MTIANKQTPARRLPAAFSCQCALLASLAPFVATAQTVQAVPSAPPVMAMQRVSLQTPFDPANPLARQIRGEVPAAKIYEDADVLALLVDQPGHFIVVAKRSQARNFMEVDAAVLARIDAVVRKVAQAEIAALGADGFLVRTTAGSQSGIAQFHVHGYPTFGGAAPATAIPRVAVAELQPIADHIRAAIR